MLRIRSATLQVWSLILAAAVGGVVVGVSLTRGGASAGKPTANPVTPGSYEEVVHHVHLRGSGTTSRGSHIALSPSRLEVGHLDGGSRHEFSVSVSAAGESSVTVGKVYSSCGCLDAKLVPPVTALRPGECATLRVVLIVPRKHGRFEDWVRITSSDRRGSAGLLRISGTSVATVDCAVEHTYEATELMGAGHEIRLLLDGSPDLPDWRPTHVVATRIGHPESGEVELTFEEESFRADEQGRHFQLAVQLPPVHECVRAKWLLSVKTSATAVSTSAVASYSVLPPVRPDRPLIVFGEVGRRRVEPIRVRFLGATRNVAFAIREARMDSPPGQEPDFVASVGQDDRGPYVEVAFVGPTDRARSMESHLVVETSRLDSDLLRIPTRAFVSAASASPLGAK